MGSAKSFATLLFIFSLGIASIAAQTSKVQKLYSRSFMNVDKESTPSKKITLNILDKDHQPLEDSYVKIVGTDLEFEANVEGVILIELPTGWEEEDLELNVYGKSHYSKTIHVSLFQTFEASRTVSLKYKKFTTYGGCPSF